MVDGKVYAKGWHPDEIGWAKFDPAKVEPWMLTAIKAAALVEFNAPDYVSYLKRVFKDAGPEALADIEQWGREESQHGETLGRWAETADPSFKLDEAFARFRKSYRPTHFVHPHDVSVRGSRRGEMIARCIVESGTSSYPALLASGAIAACSEWSVRPQKRTFRLRARCATIGHSDGQATQPEYTLTSLPTCPNKWDQLSDKLCRQ